MIKIFQNSKSSNSQVFALPQKYQNCYFFLVADKGALAGLPAKEEKQKMSWVLFKLLLAIKMPCSFVSFTVPIKNSLLYNAVLLENSSVLL